MEHQVSELLINAWAFIFTLMLTAYVALDGFDLGIGILSLTEPDLSRKATMMGGLSGVWDANETWLVLLGGTLFGAFPLAYAAALEVLYIPVLLMLFGLIFRGVAFEYCLYARRPAGWFLAFGIGSLVAALAQGLAFGTLVGGKVGTETDATAQMFDWLNPFSVFAAIILINLYVLLGACYLFNKAEATRDLSESARCWALRATLAICIFLPIFAWLSRENMASVGERWENEPLLFITLASSIIISLLMLLQALHKRRRRAPFVLALTSLIFAVIGLVLSHYPYLIPGAMTLHGAASAAKTLQIMLYAVGGLLPFILGYNFYQYYVFRDPIKSDH